MKLIILAAVIAVVASSPVGESQSWPWQVGKAYYYDVESFSWTKYQESSKVGNSFKAKFIVRVKAPGHLFAKLDNPQFAQAQTLLDGYTSDLKYNAVEKIDQVFEIKVEGGRVLALNVPSSFSITYVNLIKGLVSALQVDLTTFGAVHDYPNTYDKSTFQGLFKKFEADVTGDCETVYSVSPLSSAWRRELPKFTSAEDPIEIVKTKNYATCNKRSELVYNVPEDSVWKGVAQKNEERQFIKYSTEARIIAGKQGTIYKSEVVSSAFVAPLAAGHQKAEVSSFVKLYLNSVEQDTGAEWQLSEATKTFDSLLYTLDWSEFGNFGDEAAVANAQKLLQELTPLLQNSNNLPKANFLSKFNVLARLLFTVTSEQLNVLTSSVEIAKSSKNVAKNNMWIIYRDAVAQAGSEAAFKEIKSWILNKKIEGEEAAQVIASVANNFAWPSKEDAKELYELAFNPVVTEQKNLNATALLAAAKVYRRIGDKEFINGTFIPRLEKNLKHAVKEGDSRNAQLYIRVLANLDSEEVLKVFAPYLEGAVPTTKYLRILMVASLRKLAIEKNEVVRTVLYNILRNSGESFEIRAAAAYSIILAFPTLDMLQVMAHMTNDDPSIQIRSILQSNILFAADRLKDPRFAELTKNARTVKYIVNKNIYGYFYSANSMMDSYTGDDDIGWFRQIAFVGSEDSVLPVYHHSGYRSLSTSESDENLFILSVSKVQQFFDYVSKTLLGSSEKKVVDAIKYTAKKIYECLKPKVTVPTDEVAGALYVEIMNQERLFVFDEHEIASFIFDKVKTIENSFSGWDGSFTKIVNQKQRTVIFPLASGAPFFYEYSVPALFNARGKIHVDASKGFPIMFDQELSLTYARNFEGSVGFIDTLGKTWATTGVVSKFQVHIPAKARLAFVFNDVKVSFFFPEEDTTIIHKSIVPYTSVQKKNILLSVFEEPSTKLIERSSTYKRTKDVVVGKWSGIAYSVKGYSYSSDYYNFEQSYKDELFNTLNKVLYTKDIALTDFNFKYLAKESKNKELSITTLVASLSNHNETGELGAAFEEDLSKYTKEDRAAAVVKKVSSGIKFANVKVVDISAVFSGKQNVEFVFTIAFAGSYADRKIQGGFYYNGYDQISGVYKLITPKKYPLNFEEALKNELKTKYEGNVKIAGKLDVDFEGYGERSETYTQVLKNDPDAQKCLNDVSNHNLYQIDCYRLVIKAHAPDFFKAKLTYKLKSDIKYELEFFYNYYLFLRQFYSLQVQENPLKTVADGTVEIQAQSFYYEQYINYEVVTKYGALNVNKVKAWPHYPYRMAMYGPIDAYERSFNVYVGDLYLPHCTVDYSKVYTFSGRSYDYSLSSSWHVVMVDENERFSKPNELVILARGLGDGQKQVYIAYQGDKGQYVEVDIKPTSIDVKSNVNKTTDDVDLTTYLDDNYDEVLLEYYNLGEGVKVFSIKNGLLRIVYDGRRLVIFTDDYRGSTWGICGRDTSEISDDYLTPWGLVDEPEYYGASFSLDGEYSDAKTEELKKEAKLKVYQPVTKYTKIFNYDWDNFSNRSA